MKLLLLLCLLSLWLGLASAQEIRVVTVAEDADAVLPCSSNGAVEEFDWKKENEVDEDKEVFLYTGGSHDDKLQDKQFKGRVFIFKDELRAGNASLKIHSTKLEDNGTYICVLGPLDKPSRQEFYIRLNVDGLLKMRTVSGAAVKPGMNKLKGTGDWSTLLCEAHGVPKPEVEWKDSSGNVLPPKEPKVTERDRRFYVTSELNVTKTDHYTCVVTQKEIYHQINNTIFEDFQGVPVILIVSGVLNGIFLFVCLVYCIRKYRTRQPQNGTPSNEENTLLKGYTSGQGTDPQIIGDHQKERSTPSTDRS